jgi:hypothetical protein
VGPIDPEGTVDPEGPIGDHAGEVCPRALLAQPVTLVREVAGPADVAA